MTTGKDMMDRRELTAGNVRAVVKVSVTIESNGPWATDCSAGQIAAQAKDEAVVAIQKALKDAPSCTLSKVDLVRVVFDAEPKGSL